MFRSTSRGLSGLCHRNHHCTSSARLATAARTMMASRCRTVAPPCVKKCHFSSSSSSTTATTTTTTTTNSTSSSPSWLEGDIGKLGTTIYHSLNVGLAVVVPIYFLTPERYANGYISKTVGFLMSTAISLHSFIGLNYVCRDYVPKISSKLLGPARIATAAFTLIMFVGMSKIALFSPNGVKGVITGLWIPSSKTKNDAMAKADQ